MYTRWNVVSSKSFLFCAAKKLSQNNPLGGQIRRFEGVSIVQTDLFTDQKLGFAETTSFFVFISEKFLWKTYIMEIKVNR